MGTQVRLRQPADGVLAAVAAVLWLLVMYVFIVGWYVVAFVVFGVSAELSSSQSLTIPADLIEFALFRKGATGS